MIWVLSSRTSILIHPLRIFKLLQRERECPNLTFQTASTRFIVQLPREIQKKGWRKHWQIEFADFEQAKSVRDAVINNMLDWPPIKVIVSVSFVLLGTRVQMPPSPIVENQVLFSTCWARLVCCSLRCRSWELGVCEFLHGEQELHHPFACCWYGQPPPRDDTANIAISFVSLGGGTGKIHLGWVPRVPTVPSWRTSQPRQECGHVGCVHVWQAMICHPHQLVWFVPTTSTPTNSLSPSIPPLWRLRWWQQVTCLVPDSFLMVVKVSRIPVRRFLQFLFSKESVYHWPLWMSLPCVRIGCICMHLPTFYHSPEKVVDVHRHHCSLDFRVRAMMGAFDEQ